MKKEFENKKNFDMDRIKDPMKKSIVCSALYYMQLTLTPLLYINYLHAISHTHYKVAMEIFRAIGDDGMHNAEDDEQPQISSVEGQCLLAAILYDIHYCIKTYHGGFVYGIIDKMNLVPESTEYETIKTFLAYYLTRMNDYVCKEF